MSPLKAMSGDNHAHMLAYLTHIRKTKHSINDHTFINLVKLLGNPNPSILDITLSIVANCCIKDHYKKLFLSNNGLQHLLLILQNVSVSDSVACRICRLLGNILDKQIAKIVSESGVTQCVLQYIKNNPSSETLQTALRALGKVFLNNGSGRQVNVKELFEVVSELIISSDIKVQKAAFKLLLTIISQKMNLAAVQIPKTLVTNLVKSSRDEACEDKSVECLSLLACNNYDQFKEHLEGSGVAEVFIAYFKKKEVVNSIFLKAFHALCTEGAIRMKVRESGILLSLLDCCKNGNTNYILNILYCFEYDRSSIKILCNDEMFIELLTSNINPKSKNLLYAVLKLETPVMTLVADKNLKALIHSDCIGILKQMISKQYYLVKIIPSGRVWEIVRVGCSMEHIGATVYGEGLIVQFLLTGEQSSKDNVALAVPFLVQSRNFKLLYKLFANHGVIDIILKLFEANPLEERVLASIVRLVNIVRTNCKTNINNETITTDNYFETFIQNKSETLETLASVSEGAPRELPRSCSDMVVFELDCGACVPVRKDVLTTNSPVLDAMLNGHFIEAQQDRVRLRLCSPDALNNFILALGGELASNLNIQSHLEILGLSEKYMIPQLNNKLTEQLQLTKDNCMQVYKWIQTAGHTTNFAIIRQRIYDFLFSSEEHLLVVMQDEHCRLTIVNEISRTLSHFLKDLL